MNVESRKGFCTGDIRPLKSRVLPDKEGREREAFQPGIAFRRVPPNSFDLLYV